MSDTPNDLSKIIESQSKDIKDLDIDSDELAIQRDLRLLKVRRYSSDTFDRKWLAKWTAIVVSVWLLLVIIILILNHKLFLLSDAVLIALLGTTTLNVLGLSFIVLRGHFQSHSE